MKVITYQLAYLSGREVTLCDRCVRSDDHNVGALGPVSRGEHNGVCEGRHHDVVDAPRFTRTDRSDGASEVLTLVRLVGGSLAGKRFSCAALHGREYPYLVQVTTGVDMSDSLVGLYDLDGDKVDVGNAEWTTVANAPAEVIDQIENGWESGSNVVERI